jgi:ubiquinone/menaquinone biosynthesis C-methylase UbiE
VRYVAGDLSPAMLRRARAAAKRRDLNQIEFTEADVEALPPDDASFDSASATPDCTASLTRRRRL